MNRHSQLNRRRFLGSAVAATVGSLLIPRISRLHAAPIRENEH